MTPNSTRSEGSLFIPSMPNNHSTSLVAAGSVILLMTIAEIGAITGCRSPQMTESAPVTYSNSYSTQVIKNAVPLQARPLPLSDVRLTGGPLKNAQELDANYLLELNPDQIMYYLREDAGLKPKADRGDGGWDGPGRNLTGHIAGHYLSSVSYMYRCHGRPAF